MSIDLYEEQARVIRKAFERGNKVTAKRRYENLSNIFIQDSINDVGTPFYGISMYKKDSILFQLQGLFI